MWSDILDSFCPTFAASKYLNGCFGLPGKDQEYGYCL